MSQGIQDARVASLPTQGFIRLPQVLAVFPVGRSTWWAGVRSGRFPQPVKLGPRVTAWDVAAIRALIERFASGGSDAPAAFDPDTESAG